MCFYAYPSQTELDRSVYDPSETHIQLFEIDRRICRALSHTTVYASSDVEMTQVSHKQKSV